MESATPRLRHTGERATLEDTGIKSSWKTKCPALTGRSTSTKPEAIGEISEELEQTEAGQPAHVKDDPSAGR